MRPGVKMHKLSMHVKATLDGLKMRRGDAGGSEWSPPAMEIIHVSMEESRRRTQPPEAPAANKAPMNYWVTSDDESSIYSAAPSRDASYVDVLDSDDQSTFTPLRSAPEPAAAARHPAPKPKQQPRRDERRRGGADSPTQPRWFSHDEWAEKTEVAMFGSVRGAPRPSTDGEGEGEGDKRASGSSTEVEHVVPQAPRQASGITVREGQEPRALCSTALNDLLFTTNAQLDADLHDMMEAFVNGRALSTLTDDFEAVVDHAYACFMKAAQPILDITNETTRQPGLPSRRVPSLRRYPSNRYAGSMESLLSEIVDCYTSQSEDTHRAPEARWQRGSERVSPRRSVRAESQMESLGIDIVKYTKDQLRRYAVTSVSKHVSSQVLVSTGIENDLADRLQDAELAQQATQERIATLEAAAAEGDSADLRTTRELGGLRKKNLRLKRTARQLRNDTRDASSIRRIFEMALLEIQLL
ncbi:hypothetical protein H4R18_004903 [Coemansia javaensis]|uniref:Uncharacterized protein n=1 Tax=Coemansia javaensis TaxID=2761396 RepID=A0A9W8H332_9FUNG|nr:hypothetical protein H4R18_004903 [Coemansia javaensis]